MLFSSTCFLVLVFHHSNRNPKSDPPQRTHMKQGEELKMLVDYTHPALLLSCSFVFSWSAHLGGSCARLTQSPATSLPSAAAFFWMGSQLTFDNLQPRRAVRIVFFPWNLRIHSQSPCSGKPNPAVVTGKYHPPASELQTKEQLSLSSHLPLRGLRHFGWGDPKANFSENGSREREWCSGVSGSCSEEDRTRGKGAWLCGVLVWGCGLFQFTHP